MRSLLLALVVSTAVTSTTVAQTPAPTADVDGEPVVFVRVKSELPEVEHDLIANSVCEALQAKGIKELICETDVETLLKSAAVRSSMGSHADGISAITGRMSRVNRVVDVYVKDKDGTKTLVLCLHERLEVGVDLNIASGPLLFKSSGKGASTLDLIGDPVLGPAAQKMAQAVLHPKLHKKK